MGFRVKGVQLRVYGIGFVVWDFGLTVEGYGIWVLSIELMVNGMVQGFRV